MRNSKDQLTVLYGGKPVGDFFCDILVERSVVLELKSRQDAGDESRTAIASIF